MGLLQLAGSLALLLQLAEGAVIGIDLGGEFIKASLVKPRVPLDIVLNPEGRRRSEAIVGFFDGEQAYGGAAANQVRGVLGAGRARARARARAGALSPTG